jgi:hypothetical protein
MAAKVQYNFNSKNHPVGHKPARLVVRQINSVVDVFHGEQGFRSDEWTRYQMVKLKGQVYLKYLKGAPLNKQDELALLNQFKAQKGE